MNNSGTKETLQIFEKLHLSPILVSQIIMALTFQD